MMRLFLPVWKFIHAKHNAHSQVAKFHSGHRKKSSNKRIKFHYAENKSAALRFDLSDRDLAKLARDKGKLVEQSKKLIQEHAARRVDLFFYSLVAFYKSHLSPMRGRTFLQHGVGRAAMNGANITQGCHSSFFGNLVDKANSKSSLLSGTHFINSLNATVELPGFVNKMDDELEEGYQGRTQSLRILQDVAQANKTPTEGMQAFFKLMEKLFLEIEKGRYDSRIWPSYRIKSDVLAMQRLGTFINKWKTDKQVINDEYIEMLLRLTPEEKMRCKRSSAMRTACYEEKFAIIKNEILSAHSPLTISSKIFRAKGKR